MVKVKTLKKGTRSTASGSKSKSENTCCCDCQKELDDDAQALQCEKCGETEGVWRCCECLRISGELYDLLVSQSDNNHLHWFCTKCEKSVFRPPAKTDAKIDTVLQVLAQALERIEALERSVNAPVSACRDIEDKLKLLDEKLVDIRRSQNTLESSVNESHKTTKAVQDQLQLLADLTVPPSELFNTTLQADDCDGAGGGVAGVKLGEDEETRGTVVTSVQKRWSDLFKCISDVSTEMKAVRSTTKVDAELKIQQLKQSESDDTTRSVVIHGLCEQKGIGDALLIDEIIKSLDATISVSSHRRLRKRTAASDTSPGKSAPILVNLTTSFDRVKLLSLSSRLKSSGKFSSVFIKKALTRGELDEVNAMRQACKDANDRLMKDDHELETKYSVIDCKIRRLFRSADTYKVDWSRTFTISDVSKN